MGIFFSLLRVSFLKLLLAFCIKMVLMSTVQACLWFACQPKEPENIPVDFKCLS